MMISSGNQPLGSADSKGNFRSAEVAASSSSRIFDMDPSANNFSLVSFVNLQSKLQPNRIGGGVADSMFSYGLWEVCKKS